MENGERIKDLRQKIDRADEQILRLLNERAEIVLEVGKMKSEARSNFYDPKRESEVLHRLLSRNVGPFPGYAISPVFHEIISACRSLEVKLDVVYLGPEATNTHMACLDRFGSSFGQCLKTISRMSSRPWSEEKQAMESSLSRILPRDP